MSGFQSTFAIPAVFSVLVILCHGTPTCHLGPPVYCTSSNATISQEVQCLKCDVLKLIQMTTRLKLTASSANSYNKKNGFVSGNIQCDSLTAIKPIVLMRSTFNKTKWIALSVGMKLKTEFSFMEKFSRILSRINIATYTASADPQATKNFKLVKTDLLSLQTATTKAAQRAENITVANHKAENVTAAKQKAKDVIIAKLLQWLTTPQGEKIGSNPHVQTSSQAPTSVQTVLTKRLVPLVDCVLKELYTATLRFKVNFYYLQQNI